MKHKILEKNTGLLALCMTVAVSIGDLTQITPLFSQDMINTPVEGMKPYTALQLEGRDTYIREGCIDCHSQMIRPFRTETERYGHYLVVGKSVWDHPFLQGSKHTDLDLTYVSSRYSDNWHRAYLFNPRNAVPESKIPACSWLVENELDGKNIEKKFEMMRTPGVSYTDEDIKGIEDSLKGKAETDAVIAYLQVLGTSIKNKR